MSAMENIAEVTPKESHVIIDTRYPRGLFYLEEDGVHVGIDNSTGHAWTEGFDTKEECIAWLNGESEEEELDKKEVYRQVIEKWGKQGQICMVFEEMSELQKELCKNLRGRKNVGKIAEEIADVEVMLEQMKLLYDIENRVRYEKEMKIERLKERVKG